MNSIHSVLDLPVFHALGWTLVHFVWEGAAVGLLVLIARAALRKDSASLRYGASCAALTLLLVVPAVTFLIEYSSSVGAAASLRPPIKQEEPALASAQPTLASYDLYDSAPRDSGITAPAESASAIFPGVLLRQWLKQELGKLMPWFIGVWLLGVLLLSSRFVGGLIVAQRLKTTGVTAAPDEWHEKLISLKRRIGVSRPVRLYKSLIVEVPTVIGWISPVILIPVSALTGLGPDQLEALLAHELAHIRRYDYLINIIQTAVETLLFYHPVVWWVSKQVRAERENCCDDLAVSACGDVLTYARALAELETLRTRRPQLAMAADGGSLLNRIERLVGRSAAPNRHQVGPSVAVLAAIAAVMIFLAGAGGVEPVLVRGAIQEARLIGISTQSGHAQAARDASSTGTAQARQQPSPNTDVEDSDRARIPDPAAATPQPDSVPSPDPSTSAAPSSQAEKPEKADDFVAAMKSAFGSKELSIDDLVALKIQGVTGDYIREMRSAGYDNLTVRQVIALKIQGITADYVKQMTGAGYPKLPINELISMKIQGVSPDYIASMSQAGFTNLPASKIIGMKIQGVTPEYVAQMKAAGYDKLSPNDLIGMKIQGVNPEYVKEMKSTGLDDLSARTLVSLKTMGVDPEYVREMRSVGFGGNSARNFIAMKAQGVNPEYVKQMRDAGLKDLTDREIIGLKIQDVTPEYIRTMASAGYSNLTSNELISMRIQGVDPEFIKEMKASGYSGLKAEELIALRIHSVDADFIKRMRAHGFKDLTVRQLIQLKNAGIE